MELLLSVFLGADFSKTSMYYVLTLYTFYCRLSRTQIVCFLNTIFNSFLASFCIQMGNT